MSDSVKNTPIVQYSDADGNRAYAYTHWEAIDGKPDKIYLTSPNGTKFIISVDDDGQLLINNNVYEPTSNEIAKAQETAQKALDGLNTRVSQTDYDKKTGELSGSISAIKQTAGEISQTVSQVSGKLDNLKVGGRNLLLGTQGWTGSVWDYSGIPIDPSNTYNALVIAETSSAWNSPKYKPQSIADRGLWVGDKDYVFSAYVRNTSETDVYVYPFADVTNISFTPSNTPTTIKAHSDWTRVSRILHVNNQVDLNNPLRWEADTSVTTGKICSYTENPDCFISRA